MTFLYFIAEFHFSIIYNNKKIVFVSHKLLMFVKQYILYLKYILFRNRYIYTIIIIMQLLKTFHRCYVNFVMIFDDITLMIIFGNHAYDYKSCMRFNWVSEIRATLNMYLQIDRKVFWNTNDLVLRPWKGIKLACLNNFYRHVARHCVDCFKKQTGWILRSSFAKLTHTLFQVHIVKKIWFSISYGLYLPLLKYLHFCRIFL